MIRHLFALGLLCVGASASAAAWRYSGTLDDDGHAANGRYDLRLSLVDEAGTQVLAGPLTIADVAVVDGRFSVGVDFGIDPARLPGARLRTEIQRDAGGFVALQDPARVLAGGPPADVCWGLDGNAGTDPASQFIGTTDATPLVLATAGARALALVPSGITFQGLPMTAAVVGGSRANEVTPRARGAVVRGGGAAGGDPDFPSLAVLGGNRATDAFATLSGGALNQAGNDDTDAQNGAFATVGGGFENFADRDSATVGGGVANLVIASEAVVSGGRINRTQGTRGAVGGGRNNSAVEVSSVVRGGMDGLASGPEATVLGGQGAQAGGTAAVVLGGRNGAARAFAVAMGGLANCAGGVASLAAGTRAKVRKPAANSNVGGCDNSTVGSDADGDEGSFVWADAQNADLRSDGPDSFIVRARGGVFFMGEGTLAAPADTFVATTTGASLTTGGAWVNASSRALKTGFAAIDPVDVLDRVLALDITRWRYTADAATGEHIGPMAEDFHSAFGLGVDPGSISTVDATGVTLAAIQGLQRRQAETREGIARRIAAAEAQLHATDR